MFKSHKGGLQIFFLQLNENSCNIYNVSPIYNGKMLKLSSECDRQKLLIELLFKSDFILIVLIFKQQQHDATSDNIMTLLFALLE